jgi:hypothetical protein
VSVEEPHAEGQARIVSRIAVLHTASDGFRGKLARLRLKGSDEGERSDADQRTIID